MPSLFTLLKPSTISDTPPTFPPSTSKDDEPAIPDPAVFRTSPLTASSLDLSAPPTVAQCAVHLELLQALSKLNHRVTKESAFIEIFGTVHEDAELWWNAFVEVAVGRFATWWKAAEDELRRREKSGQTVSVESGLGEVVKVRELPDELLPPLDVLMVWHSYMLNPRYYNEDALYFGFELILNTAFPWAQIHSAIDDESFDYTLPETASKFFEKLTSQSPNLIDELLWKDTAPKKRIKCPACGKEDVDVRICNSEKKGGGWVDGEFAVKCGGCGVVIDKEGLCVENFRKDLKAFLDKGDKGRMRMTYLDSNGYTPLEDPTNTSWDPANFVNTLFRTTPIPADSNLTAIAATLTALDPATPPSHLSALRLCLSAYTSTPTAFSLDLAAAVIRQGDFVSKMNDQLWIRSPGLIGTLPLDSLSVVLSRRAADRGCVLADTPDGFLARAIVRYSAYFALFRAHPGHVLVPTLDVDLVWHTAMLTPVTYRVWCRALAARFVDHDDRLAGGVLQGGFEFTAGAYWDAYGEMYAKCCCWFCEAALSEGLDPGDERETGLWARLRKKGGKERAVRVRVEFYKEVERKKRGKLGGLARVGLFEELKRC